jgi:hypothetical protein
LPLCYFHNMLFAQQAFTFNRLGTDDGIGLASNVVYCTYQDAKGFIWIGTANGLQRFDGSKFVQLSSDKNNSLFVSNLTQIVPIDSTSIWLCFPFRKEFGIFNTTTFKYVPVPILLPVPYWQEMNSNYGRTRMAKYFLRYFLTASFITIKRKSFYRRQLFSFSKRICSHAWHFRRHTQTSILVSLCK